MRIAVIGAGATGSLLSHLLHAGGGEVHLYERRAERRERLKADGLVLRGALEAEERLPVRAPGEADVPYDLIVLAVKAGDTGDALRPLSPFVHRGTLYMSVQEGFAAEELAGMVGGERVVVAVPWFSAEEGEEGEVLVEEVRSLVLGGLQAGFAASRLEELRGVLGGSGVAAVSLQENIGPEIWRRVRAAAGISCLCSLCGEVPESIRYREEVAGYTHEAAEECARVAASHGVEPPHEESPWDAAVWRRLRPPMLRDVMHGAATEVRWLCGRVAERAGERGEKTPVTGALLSLVKEMERGQRGPGEHNLRELRRRVQEEKGMSLL